MLDLQVTRIVRETLTTPEQVEASPFDLTDQLQSIVKHSRVRNGVAHVFVVGSTAAIITIEFEDGLLQDLKETLRRLVPRDLNYYHQRAWRDDNAHSHLRASLLGQQLTVPVTDGKLHIGTWQQIAVVNLDTRPRAREIVITVMGD